MPQGMQAGVFRFALIVHNTRRNHRRPHVTAHDVGVIPQLAQSIGNTKPSSPFGQASRHSFSVFTTSGPTGMTRSPDSDLGLPISL